MNARCNTHPIWPAACAALTAALVLTVAQPAAAQPGWVLSHQKISDTQGAFTGTLDNEDWFGFSVASLGDFDGDGVGDLAVGADRDDDGGVDRGAVWALFLNRNGTVKSHQKISDTEGGLRHGQVTPEDPTRSRPGRCRKPPRPSAAQVAIEQIISSPPPRTPALVGA